jgi:hypothetical protein
LKWLTSRWTVVPDGVVTWKSGQSRLKMTPDVVFGVDMVKDRADRKPGLGHDSDVDAAFVVAVDQHHVPVVVVEQLGVEPQQRGPLFGLDHGDDVSFHVADDPGGHPGADLVGGFGGQFQPADPVVPTGRGDLHVLGRVTRLGVEAAAVLP